MHANQFEHDNAAEPELSDYQDEPMLAKFAEFVTLELLAGRDCMDIDSQIFMIDLELACGGYQLALEWVCERLTEDQLKEWLNDY